MPRCRVVRPIPTLIAAAVSLDLVAAGTLKPGARLPTIRQQAGAWEPREGLGAAAEALVTARQLGADEALDAVRRVWKRF